jgi:hypothetical protein
MFRVLILCLFLFAPAALAEGLISRDPVVANPKTKELETRAERCKRIGCKPTPITPRPENATALCCDGRWSFSTNNRGTCSWHCGVKVWLRQP